MPYLLGLDTGGTYTDAALLFAQDADTDNPKLIAKSKSLTTRYDLSIGLGKATKTVLDLAKCKGEEIGLVSLSTTLATNALVEGQGARVALIAIGFSPQDMERAGLSQALGDDILIHLAGGHKPNGEEATPLDLSELESRLDELKNQVSGFAVVGYFAVRNCAHENMVREFIHSNIDSAVTCSHELSEHLNGPKRALTTLLNARLVPLITRLIDSAQSILHVHNISSSIMVVRGDGSLVSSTFAQQRPIETILSGPAASLVGAYYLAQTPDAIVCDIGGTTSDIAILQNGTPKIDERGAQVGPHRTMVEAVAMHTFGLGGDSEIRLREKSDTSESTRELLLGPRRLIPVSLLAHQYGECVHKELDKQLESSVSSRHDGRFVLRVGEHQTDSLPSAQQDLYSQITDSPKAVNSLVESATQSAVLTRLLEQGLIAISGLTPSDALHALARYDEWDSSAAEKALSLFARRRERQQDIEDNPANLAEKIIYEVERRSAEIILATIWENNDYIHHNLVQEILDMQSGAQDSDSLISHSLSLKVPLIGLGASSFQYHRACEKLLGCKVIVPDDADVANAIGAVVGRMTLRFSILVTEQNEGQFLLIGTDEIYKTEKEAFKVAEQKAKEGVAQLAKDAGAVEVEISCNTSAKRAEIESRPVLIEARIEATAMGRPPITA